MNDDPYTLEGVLSLEDRAQTVLLGVMSSLSRSLDSGSLDMSVLQLLCFGSEMFLGWKRNSWIILCLICFGACLDD